MNVNQLFPSRFLKGEDLQGRNVAVVISEVTVEEMGRDKERHPVIWFVGKQKGLVLNKTNAMTIAKLYGPETDGWVGKRIGIYAEEIRVGNEWKMAIRVAVVKPPAPDLEPGVDFPNKVEREANERAEQ